MRRLFLSICLTLLASHAWASATTAAPPASSDPSPAVAETGDGAVAFPGLDDLIARAKNGEPGAEEALGSRYEKGSGVEQDYAEAAKWYRMAADQGFTKAESELGILYSKGQGVKLDYEEAYFWLSMSFDPFKPEENKILEEIKSYLSGEQQEIVENRINSWRPKKYNAKAAAAAVAEAETCAVRDLVGTLKIRKRPWASCKEAFKDMKYACAGRESTCKQCQDAFVNYQMACSQQQTATPAYACNKADDCGLVDTDCNQSYDPVSVNRAFMLAERERLNWPLQDCGRLQAVKQKYRPVCVKQQCSVAENNAAE